MKTTTLDKFLTPKQIQAAWEIYEKAEPGEFARLCDKQVIRPNLAVIELKLNQECDSRYLAYMVEAAFNEAVRRVAKDSMEGT